MEYTFEHFHDVVIRMWLISKFMTRCAYHAPQHTVRRNRLQTFRCKFPNKNSFFLRVSNENGVLRKELTWTTAFALKPLLPLKREHDFNFGSSNPSKSYGASNASCNTLYGTCYMLLRRLAKAIISCTPFPVTAPLKCQYTSNLLAEVCFGSKPPLSNVSNNDL